MPRFSIEQFVDGRWSTVKSDVAGSVAEVGFVLNILKRPGAPWRAVRSDGAVFNP